RHTRFSRDWSSDVCSSDLPALPAWLANAVEAVRLAWRQCEPLVEWRKDEEERRKEALRALYAGKRILIAGGLRRTEWIERLRERSEERRVGRGWRARGAAD